MPVSRLRTAVLVAAASTVLAVVSAAQSREALVAQPAQMDAADAGTAGAAAAPAVPPPHDAAIRYGRDVRPILADRCFRCHGPDAGSRAAELRLDEREHALAARDGGAAIVPGAPERSVLLQRVTAHDADERMPPQGSAKPPLTPAEIATLTAWIRTGAVYEPHWAFVPPARPALPDGPESHPVDRFVGAQLRARGLAVSPPADARTLVRRVFLVLTGLPPTPAEIAAFAADASPDAYERLVDRLLGEEPYRTRGAEHLAQVWLDAGRYADTSGIHMDAGRQAWQWRDWLLHALRDDVPFDRFVVEQLAGDLLPDATVGQRVATGFLRNHVTTDEGGAIDEEYRVEYAAERTATVGSVFLGLTLACARCHDHKYDPVRQEDFFRLFAFFNSNREPGLYSQVPDANRALEPFLAVPSEAQAERERALADQLAAAEREVDEPSTHDRERFAAFCAAHARIAPAAWVAPQVIAARSQHGATMLVDRDGSVLATGANPRQDVHVVTMLVAGGGHRWLALDALPLADAAHGKVGRSPNGNAVLQHVGLEARAAGSGEPWRSVPLCYALADAEQADGDFAVGNVLDDDGRGWAVAAHKMAPRAVRALLLAAGPFGERSGHATELRATLRYESRYAQHVFGRVRFRVAPTSAAQLDALPLAASGFHVAGPFTASAIDLYEHRFGPELVTAIDGKQRWGDLAWRFDASLTAGEAHATLPKGRNVTYVAQRVHAPSARTVQVKLGSDDGFQLWCGGALVAERRVERGVAVDQDEASVTLPAGASTLVLKVVNTGGDGGFALRHVARADELTGDLRLLALPDATVAADLRARVLDAWREHRSPEHQRRRARVAELQKELEALRASIPRAMVMDEGEPRATFVLQRGEYDKPDPERPVARELPAMFGPLPSDLPKNRLGLARWLVSPANPLLLRVHANRVWEFVFGSGIVRTSEDLGLQGEWPSHPELLDWLAVELRTNGLSTRALLRTLVTSHAFRQQSRVPADAAAIDRDGRLLAWFPRRRLSAEAIRDQALFASGLLVERCGGPSVKPYQPDGLWQEVAMPQSNTRVYVQGDGAELWRRSLYTYWKRACPPPSLQAFDAPTREFCTVRRGTTNTPLQALVLWNDAQFVEAARALAQRACAEADGDDARLQRAYEHCTGRELAGGQLAAARAALTALRERFRTAPADAAALLAVGRAPRAAGDPAELAALTVVANAFLSLDQTLCID
jgi:hypothetical protein